MYNRAVEVGGAQETVSQIAFDPNNPFAAVWAPSWRMVVDMSDPDGARWQTFTGQSGHPGSRHYDELQERWQRGEMQPMAGEGPWKTLTLEPVARPDHAQRGRAGRAARRRARRRSRDARPARLAAPDAALVRRSRRRDLDLDLCEVAEGPNLERDPRATLLVETGEEYSELRGVQIEAEGELIRDTRRVVGFAKQLTIRYAEGIEWSRATPPRRSRLRRQSAWRSALRRTGSRAGTTESSAARTEHRRLARARP